VVESVVSDPAQREQIKQRWAQFRYGPGRADAPALAGLSPRTHHA
jgi:hypothetical protein